MNKVTTNQKPSEKENAATVVKTKEEKNTCDGCCENLFCELASFNDRRCQSAVSDK